MAEANLGRIGFINKKDFAHGVHKLNDVVKYEGAIYVCIEAHTSDATNNILPTDITKWQVWLEMDYNNLSNKPVITSLLSDNSEVKVASARAIKEVNDKIEEARKPLTTSITINVGESETHKTIQSALDYLIATYYPTGKATATILLMAGFVAKEQIKMRGVDLSWIIIAGQDTTTSVQISVIPPWQSFMEFIEATSPIISQHFTAIWQDGRTSPANGIFLDKGIIYITGTPQKKAGFSGFAETNIYINKGKLICYYGDSKEAKSARGYERSITLVSSSAFLHYSEVSNFSMDTSASPAIQILSSQATARNCQIGSCNIAYNSMTSNGFICKEG